MQQVERPLQKLSVLMPVYNERWTLREIIRQVLQSPVPLEIELVAVDDCSTDGSWDLLQELAALDPRIKAIRHPSNRGKGAAIRTAIDQMTGDVAVVQDADLEYDPNEYPTLLKPILDDKADAVFGSRFSGHSHRVLFFWHMVVNHILTIISNMLNDLNLTDIETCYKMVRADVLKRLRLRAETFTFEPELTCRLAQWRARIYEVPISYNGRTYDEGKKIHAIDGIKALWQMFYSKFVDPQFTDHAGFYVLTSVSKAMRYNRWLFRQVKEFLGRRLVEAGAGIGNFSGMLLNREHLVLADHEPIYVSALQRRFHGRGNVRVDLADLTDSETLANWRNDRFDTILCTNVLEHLDADRRVLQEFHDVLTPGGHCIIVVPAGQWLYTSLDRAVEHQRRYGCEELRRKVVEAGFRGGLQQAIQSHWCVGLGHFRASLPTPASRARPNGLVRPALAPDAISGLRSARSRNVPHHGGTEAAG